MLKYFRCVCPVNSISSLTLSDPDKAQDMIIRLSELLRYSLKQAPQSSVPVIQEIENCTRYLDIERVRFGSRCAVNVRNIIGTLAHPLG